MKPRVIIFVILAIVLVVVLSLLFRSFLGIDVLKITQADNGKAITMKKGQVLKLSLDSNPTTGYQWYIEELDDKLLKIVNMDFESPDTSRMGAGGKQFWKIKAINSGETKLLILYYRMWEGKDKAVKEFELNLVVSD